MSVLKEKYDTEKYEIRKRHLYIVSFFTGIGAVFFFSLWEVIILMFISLIVFIFRRTIAIHYLSVISQHNGKKKWVGKIALSCGVIWLGLALFYRTDLGMPIGVKNYLYHKYREEFDVSGFFGATIASHPTNQLTCCPQNGNPLTDSFNVVRKNTLSVGSRLFASDNYYGVWIRDDYKRFVERFLSDYFEEYEVNVEFNWSGLSNIEYMSDVFDKSTSLNDFLKYQKQNGKSCNTAIIKVYIPQKYYKDKIESISEFADNFKSISSCILIYIFYIDSNDKSSIGYTDILINSNGELYIDNYIKEV